MPRQWWSMPPGRERAAAKAEYEAAYPVPEPELRPVRTGRYTGYFVSPSGHEHHYGGQPDRRVAEMAARADVPPLPDALRPFEHDGRLSWLGRRDVYEIDLSTREAFRVSLQRALQGESGEPTGGRN